MSKPSRRKPFPQNRSKLTLTKKTSDFLVGPSRSANGICEIVMRNAPEAFRPLIRFEELLRLCELHDCYHMVNVTNTCRMLDLAAEMGRREAAMFESIVRHRDSVMGCGTSLRDEVAGFIGDYPLVGSFEDHLVMVEMWAGEEGVEFASIALSLRPGLGFKVSFHPKRESNFVVSDDVVWTEEELVFLSGDPDEVRPRPRSLDAETGLVERFGRDLVRRNAEEE